MDTSTKSQHPQTPHGTNDLPLPGGGFIWSIDMLSHLIRQRINKLLAPLNLTFPKYAAMTMLEHTPNLTNADLARACHVRPQTMNSMVRDMMNEGYLHQEKMPDHGLKLIYTLTPKAQTLLTEAHEIVASVENGLIEEISPDRVHMLKRMMAATLGRLDNTT